MPTLNCVVIFGGTGFIGSFFAKHLLESQVAEKIYLLDLEPIQAKDSKFRVNLLNSDPRIFFLKVDVRGEISFAPIEKVNLVINFAATHREPGYEDNEYFETNLLGAENVCKFAEEVGCQNIIFTSSISPYGVSEVVKDESTLPIPVTAYGSSKLVAEKIHQIWQAKDVNNRRLVIVRPGVVFGPGEGGNVSRLIKAVIHRYFFFMGNESTRKAGVYVKELCNAMWWVLQEQKKNGETVSLFNMSMNPGPSISEYVKAVCRTQGIKRYLPTVPYKALMAVAFVIDALARPLGIKHPFSPVRIRKLVRSNNIIPTYLVDHGYQFQYSLDSAFADWKKSCPEEWK
ncbi:NAD(P)-dependent oxidoreductase [Polynucleobacter sp. AP-Reno-20A-A9]|uniref:NAD-dependent epimerase/dehydratase family protein n=1 Tax=Polynucleobacter sp. AP-Reno-20A-A9 TaxID=2576925 RepID=UPI001C0CA3CE|nr:NAD(P)-dependent oxidoreductase [Polynucleobacter sp. AP-Reno-20A-A9]MBU3629310.1 NAD(P)-dependent oxidoreductase [Polynucleobacter sp. AP-Reno-20A-A9]